MWQAFLVDDEPLALKRLARLLAATGRVSVVGTSADPVEALAALRLAPCDVLFLDIEMPGLTGFQLLEQLDPQPLVVFTTAYSEYALQAFDVNSLAYLLKPVEPEQLERALNKLDRIRGGQAARPDVAALLAQLRQALPAPAPSYPDRLPSRSGEKVEFLELHRVTHFYAEDKLTFAATPDKAYVIDATIADLETRLDPRRFLRIHRSTMVNVDFIQELHQWFGGRLLVRLKDQKKTELTVARDRVKDLKDRLGV